MKHTSRILEHVQLSGNTAIDFSDWTHKEWEEYRGQEQGGLPTVGGSEICQLSGTSPYGGPAMLYKKKVEGKSFSEIDPAYSITGHMMEPLVREDVLKQLQVEYPTPRYEVVVESFDYLVHNTVRAINAICNLDGVVVIHDHETKTSKYYVLEIKTMSSDNVIKKAGKGILPYHYDQAIWYSDIFPFDGIIFGYMKKGILFPVDMTIIEMNDMIAERRDHLYSLLNDFNESMKTNTQPEPTDTDIEWCNDLDFVKPTEVMVSTDKEFIAQSAKVKAMAEEYKKLEEAIKEEKAKLMKMIPADAKKIITNDYTVNVVTRRNRKIDMELVKILHPEVIPQCMELKFSETLLETTRPDIYEGCTNTTITKYATIKENN